VGPRPADSSDTTDTTGAADSSGTTDTSGTTGTTGTSAPTYSLYVLLHGDGTVSSTPAGILCPDACFASFEQNTTVILTATPHAGWHFAEWGADGAPVQADGSILMDSAKQVTAVFFAN